MPKPAEVQQLAVQEGDAGQNGDREIHHAHTEQQRQKRHGGRGRKEEKVSGSALCLY